MNNPNAGGSFYGYGPAGPAGAAGAAGVAGVAGVAGAAGAAGPVGRPEPTAVATGTRMSQAATASTLTTVALSANRIHYCRYRHALTNAYTALECTVTTAAAGGTRLTLCLFKSTANAPAGLVWYSAPIAADAAAPFAANAAFSTGTKVLAGEFVGNNFTPLAVEYWTAVWVEAAPTLRASAVAASEILDFGVAPWTTADASTHRRLALVWIVGAPTDPAAAATLIGTVPPDLALVAA